MATDNQNQPKVTIFTGAGASAGLGLPIASEFTHILKDKWADANVLVPEIVSFLQANGEIKDEDNLNIDLVHAWLVHSRHVKNGEERKSLEKQIIELDAIVGSEYGAVSPEAAYHHYRPLLQIFGLPGISSLPVFTTNIDSVVEAIAEYSGSEWNVESGTDLGNLKKKGIHLFKLHDLPDFYELFEERLWPGSDHLLIVIGFSFSDRRVNSIIAEVIENGMRLLVLDKDIQYKQLAERLRISDIKHKVRIEKMEFGKWNENKEKLLSGIINDEVRRMKNRNT